MRLYDFLFPDSTLSGFKVTWINNPERVEPWEGNGRGKCLMAWLSSGQPTGKTSQLLTFGIFQESLIPQLIVVPLSSHHSLSSIHQNYTLPFHLLLSFLREFMIVMKGRLFYFRSCCFSSRDLLISILFPEEIML